MNYQRHYDLLMAKAKPRDLDKSQLTGYYELHHVLPRCMGGSDEAANLVLLTAREHFVAHWLLTKFTTGSDRHKMLYALTAFRLPTGKRSLPSRQFEKARRAHLDLMKTESVFVKVTEAVRAGRARHNAKIAKEGKHNFQTYEFRQAKSEFQKQQVACPHCGKVGGRGGMARHHFANCKQIAEILDAE